MYGIENGQLGAIAGVSKSTIERVREGSVEPKIGTVVHIQRALNRLMKLELTLDDLVYKRLWEERDYLERMQRKPLTPKQ